MDFIEVLCNRCQIVRFSVQDPIGTKLKEDDLYFACSKCLHKNVNEKYLIRNLIMHKGVGVDENGIEKHRD